MLNASWNTGQHIVRAALAVPLFSRSLLYLNAKTHHTTREIRSRQDLSVFFASYPELFNAVFHRVSDNSGTDKKPQTNPERMKIIAQFVLWVKSPQRLTNFDSKHNKVFLTNKRFWKTNAIGHSREYHEFYCCLARTHAIVSKPGTLLNISLMCFTTGLKKSSTVTKTWQVGSP